MDGSGELDRHEVVLMMKKHSGIAGFSANPSEEELDKVFAEFDTDNSGAVDIDEFLNCMFTSRKQKVIQPLRDYLTSEGLKL